MSSYAHHLPQHLAQADLTESLRSLLLHFPWMHYKLTHKGSRSTIDDYALLPHQPCIQRIFETLNMIAHVLEQDARQINGQLLGRLQAFQFTELETFFHQMEAWDRDPWLKPLRQILEPAKGPLVRSFTGHDDWVRSLAIKPDGSLVASGSQDHWVHLWNPATGEQLQSFQSDVAVTSVKFLSKSNEVIANCQAGFFAWSLKNERRSRCYQHPNHRVMAIAATSSEDEIITASLDKTLIIWDRHHEKPLHILSHHEKAISTVRITPDDRLIISGSRDETIVIWDRTTRLPIRRFSGLGGDVASVDATDECLVAAIDQTLKAWNLQSGEECFAVEHPFSIYSVRIIASRHEIVGVDQVGRLCRWRLDTGEEIGVIHAHEIITFAVDAIDAFIVTGSMDQRIRLWRPFDRPSPPQQKGGWITGMLVDPDKDQVLTFSDDCTLSVWNMQGRLDRTLTGHQDWIRAAAWTFDLIVSTSFDGTAHVWNRHTGERIATFSGHQASIHTVTLLHGGDEALTGDDDGVVKRWRVKTGEERASLIGHRLSVFSIATTPDNRYAITGSLDGDVIIWDLTTNLSHATYTGHRNGVRKVMISPDGRRVMTSSPSDRSLHIINLETCACIKNLHAECGGWSREWPAALISDDGAWLISTSNSRTIRIWDAVKGDTLTNLPGHENWVNALAITPDKNHLVSVDNGGLLIVWDLKTERSIAKFNFDNALISCAISKDGLTYVAGESSGKVHFLTLSGSP